MHTTAKLGGFLGRKSDGHPGVKTLRRGYRQLQLVLVGMDLALPREYPRFAAPIPVAHATGAWRAFGNPRRGTQLPTLVRPPRPQPFEPQDAVGNNRQTG